MTVWNLENNDEVRTFQEEETMLLCLWLHDVIHDVEYGRVFPDGGVHMLCHTP